MVSYSILGGALLRIPGGFLSKWFLGFDVFLQGFVLFVFVKMLSKQGGKKPRRNKSRFGGGWEQRMPLDQKLVEEGHKVWQHRSAMTHRHNSGKDYGIKHQLLYPLSAVIIQMLCIIQLMTAMRWVKLDSTCYWCLFEPEVLFHVLKFFPAVIIYSKVPEYDVSSI